MFKSLMNLENRLIAPLQPMLLLAGRVLIAAFFIPAGVGKLMGGYAGTVAYATSAGLPLPEISVALAIAIEVIIGIAFVLGFMTRSSALILALFTAVASFYFHNYWAMPAEMQGMQSIMFWNHIALVGGLLAYAVVGAGQWSADHLLSGGQERSGKAMYGRTQPAE